MPAMLNFLSRSWKFAKKTVFLSIVFLILIGFFSIFFIYSSAHADSREAQIDQLTSDLVIANSGDENQLKEIARKRKDLLIEEAISNPEGFLRSTKLINKKNDFSSSIHPDLEEEIATEGELLVVHFDGKDSTKTDYKLITQDKKVFDLHFAKNVTKLQTGSKVKLKAIRIDSHLVLEAADQQTNTTSMETLSVASSSSIGEKRVAVLLVNFFNDGSTPVSQAEMDNIILSGSTSVNAYYQENSFNQTNLTGQVYGWFRLSQTNSSCETNFYNWSTEADNLAVASGVNLSSYNRIVYIFPTPVGCTYGGLGTIGGDPGRSWIFDYHTDGRIHAHELGHNIGIHHANSLSCGSKAIDVYANCTTTEYGDVFDVMGNFWYVSPYMLQFNGAHKASVGWIPTTRIITATSSGTFQIYPLETVTANPQIIKINKPDTSESYVVSYRQPVGFDIGLLTGITRGANIHILNNDLAVQTQFIDTTPLIGDLWGTADAALQDGQKFIDTINNIEILQTSHTPNYVEVQVAFPLSDTIAPTAAITYPANNATVKGTITVTTSISDNIGVERAELWKDGVLFRTEYLAPFSFQWITNKETDGNYTLQVKAYDAAGNVGSSSILTVKVKNNLLLNNSFETDSNADGKPDNWTINSNVTRSSTYAQNGTYSMRHSSTANATYNVGQKVSSLTAGKVYKFSGWARIPSTSDTFSFKLQIVWRNSSGSTLRTDTVKTYSSATSGWNNAVKTLTAPANTSYALVRMAVSSLNAKTYADNFYFAPQ